MNRPRICTRCPSCHWSAVLYDPGVGGVLEVVRPKVGAAEGRVGGGPPPPPPLGKFSKRHKILRSGNFWHTSGAVCSRVQYSVRLQMHNRSTSTSLEKGLMRICKYRWILIFYYGFARSRRTTLFEKWRGHRRTSRSGCYDPVTLFQNSMSCPCQMEFVSMLSGYRAMTPHCSQRWN